MAADAVYWLLLTAARDKVADITGLRTARMSLRKEPAFVALRDQVPQVIIAPDPDLAERIYQEQFGVEPNTWNAFIDYDIYTLLITERRYDEELLRFRLARREEIRIALYISNLLGASVLGEFDCVYNPRPSIDLSWLPDTLDVIVQLFTYRVSQTLPGGAS